MSEDKWIATCVVFLETVHDSLEFTNACQIGDTVSIEVGYLINASRYGVLGQNKYVHILLRKEEVLYRHNPFLRIQEYHMNWVV